MPVAITWDSGIQIEMINASICVNPYSKNEHDPSDDLI